jgi:DNA primase large subunit
MSTEKISEVGKKAKEYGFKTKIMDGCICIGKTLTIEDEEYIEYDQGNGKVRLWYPQKAAVSVEQFEKNIREQENMLELAGMLKVMGSDAERERELKLLEELKKKYEN